MTARPAGNPGTTWARTGAPLALGAWLALAVASPAWGALPAGVLKRIDRGEVVCLTKFSRPLYTFDVLGYVDGTPDEVWRAITQYDRYQEFLPLVTASAIRRKKAPGLVYQYVKMAPPWPFHEMWMVNANQEYRARGVINFHETEGNVKTEYGYWQIVPAGARTRLLYHLTADPWMDYIPPFVVNQVTQVFLPNVVKGVRKRVLQDRRARR